MKNKNQKQLGPKTVSKKYPMNIDQGLYDSWQLKRRTGDTTAIAEAIGWSLPIVERALNFGHAKEMEVIDGITNFYLKRAQREKKQAEKLNNL